jgi:hypothetical protein
MTMVLLGAGYCGALCWTAAEKSRAAFLRRVVPALLLGTLAVLLQPNWINVLFGTGLSLGLVVAVLIVKAAAAVAALWLLTASAGKRRSPAHRIAVAGLGALLFGVMTFTPALSRDGWAEFSCRLDDPAVRAGTRIYISRMKPIDPNDMLIAYVDLNQPSGHENSYDVVVNNSAGEFGKYGVKHPFFYPKPVYWSYGELMHMGLEHIRQYTRARVEIQQTVDFVRRFGYIDISVSINDRIPEKDNYVTIYGTYADDRDGVWIPSPDFYWAAVERYVHRNDPRIHQHVKFLSDSTVSYYIGRDSGEVSPGADLSPAPGYQTGRYHIFLVHFTPDGIAAVY